MNSTGTEPTYGLKDWITILHNAAKVAPDHPRYTEARQVIPIALQGISENQATAQASDPDELGKYPGKAASAAVAFGHGASLGLAGDKQYLQLAHQAHPVVTTLSDILGTGATASLMAAAPIFAGASPVVTGAVVGGTTAAARGAIEPLPNFSRAESALIYGTGAALAGAAAAKLVPRVIGPLVGWVRRVAQNIRGITPGLASAEVQGVTEATVRQELTRLKVSPDVIERTVAAWKATPPPAPPTLRPGETVEPIAEKGLAVYGTRATPPPPANGSFWEQVNGTSIRDLGKGQTLPYYPRGGSVEQGYAPTPQSAMPNLAPNQNSAFADFLKGATPEDLASRVGTLRALGIPLPPNAETELLAYLQAGTPR